MFCIVVVLLSTTGYGRKNRELVLGSAGSSDYQVVLPDQGNEALERAAGLVKDAFAANGFAVPVVKEREKDASKPGIYIGDTEYARAAGIDPEEFESWDYLLRVIAKDLIIAGSHEGIRYGVVKGVCDFLREYAGTRFLYPGETGIEFLETQVISVPADLDLTKRSMIRFNYSSDMYPEEWLYNTANNHFPPGFKFGGHMWEAAIPFDEYYETHPEYFALVNGNRYDRERKSQYCISNPRVMELIVEYMVELARQGREVVVLAQPDAFTPCQCEECHKLYGTGEDWDEKVWLFHYGITKRFQEKAPDTKVLMLAYQATTHPPKTIDRLPKNTMVYLSHAHDFALKEWSESGLEIPGGIVLQPRMFGSHYIVNYLPKRTPDWLESRVKSYHRSDIDIVGLRLFVATKCYGLGGPAYYVFGRMFDDPGNYTSGQLTEEFYTAAFGEAVDPMRRFYGLLHDNLRFCSQWFFPRSASRFFIDLDRKPAGIDDQLDWVRVSTARFGSRGMHRGIPDPGHGLSLIYTAELALAMETKLEKAEALAVTDKVKRRLELVRMEFDYMKKVSLINNLYNAWKTNREPAAARRLLNGIDEWNALLDSYYDEGGRVVKISGWPEILPFRGTGRRSLGLISARWWRDKEIDENPYAWDTEKMRTELNLY